jgi:hypothetical protein
LVDNEKNDLTLELELDQRYIAEFRHMDKSISLVARNVTFSHFRNPETGVVERFNVSTIRNLKLKGEMLEKAEQQDPSITCHVYGIREKQKVIGISKCARTSTDGGYISKGVSAPPVTFTTGQKSRVDYDTCVEVRDRLLETFTFIMKVGKTPDIQLF